MNRIMMMLALVAGFAAPSLSWAESTQPKWTTEFSGTYRDYGFVPEWGFYWPFPDYDRIPAKLRVSVDGDKAEVQLDAPGARCVPSFGETISIGPSPWLFASNTLRIVVRQDPKNCYWQHHLGVVNVTLDEKNEKVESVELCARTNTRRSACKSLFTTD